MRPPGLKNEMNQARHAQADHHRTTTAFAVQERRANSNFLEIHDCLFRLCLQNVLGRFTGLSHEVMKHTRPRKDVQQIHWLIEGSETCVTSKTTSSA